MENNQQESVDLQPAAQMQITPEAVSFLATTAKWAKFLAIIGFILTGFLILAGLIVTVFFGTYSSQMMNTGLMSYFSSGYIGIVYIVIAVIYILPIFYLNNFSNATTRAVRSGSTERLTYAFHNLKRFFKFIGLVIIGVLVIYLLILGIAVGAGIYMFGS